LLQVETTEKLKINKLLKQKINIKHIYLTMPNKTEPVKKGTH
jgi:hypothetical protein